MSDESNGTGRGTPLPDPEEYEAESRWITWKESAARRFSRTTPVADEQPPEPFESPRAFGQWSVEAARGLLDVQFRRTATRTLLPLVYMLGLVFAFAVPIALTVSLWRVSAVLGVLAALIGVPLGLTIAPRCVSSWNSWRTRPAWRPGWSTSASWPTICSRRCPMSPSRSTSSPKTFARCSSGVSARAARAGSWRRTALVKHVWRREAIGLAEPLIVTYVRFAVKQCCLDAGIPNRASG